MSIESNRAVAVKFYDLMGKMEFEKMFDLLAEDAKWRVAGNPETFWPAGTRTKAERVKLFGDFAETFKSMETKILSSTAEQDRVVLELTLKGVTHSGLVYENEYLLLLRFRDNKIVYLYEQLDQQATLAFAKAVEAEHAK